MARKAKLAYDRGDHGTDDFSRLNRVLKKSGLYCKDIAGDGNCMFRALADQVDGAPDTHQRHRESVCDYMRRHPDEFEPFMDETSTFARYLDNMRQLGVYGGNLELVAFARNYRVDIKVYQTGGTVFVISGAPADKPDDPHRSMPAVHIAYHSYEHYSSVRNKSGPHSGLPEVKESIRERRLFSRVLNGAVEPVVVGTDVDLLRDAMVPSRDVPITSEMSLRPESASSSNSFCIIIDAEDSPEETESSEPTSVEKMIMSSTGVANWQLVRRLLQKHAGDEGQVVELLIQWMADEHADPGWWAEDGPADYDGPPPDETSAQPDTPPAAVDPTAADKPDGEDATADDSAAKKTQKPKHVKGMARQRKLESKKRQKEMAKIKKRQAAREAAAGGSAPPAGTDPGSTSDHRVIYI
ncbi:2-oxoglutarate dehydrogenase E1 component [Coemansia sp. RSA 2704]|nr:2-oxoglutarate dehydrogenase E1 component [Coemansia sp. RSA 2704]